MNVDKEEFKKMFINFKNKNGEKKYISQFSQFDIIPLLLNNKYTDSLNLYKNFKQNKNDNSNTFKWNNLFINFSNNPNYENFKIYITILMNFLKMMKILKKIKLYY